MCACVRALNINKSTLTALINFHFSLIILTGKLINGFGNIINYIDYSLTLTEISQTSHTLKSLVGANPKINVVFILFFILVKILIL